MIIINFLTIKNANSFLAIKLIIQIFCYCPLYALGTNCGGNFKYTDKGIKDCSNCLLPHNKNNYDYIMSKFQDIIKITKIND